MSLAPEIADRKNSPLDLTEILYRTAASGPIFNMPAIAMMPKIKVESKKPENKTLFRYQKYINTTTHREKQTIK